MLFLSKDKWIKQSNKMNGYISVAVWCSVVTMTHAHDSLDITV